MTRTQVYFDKEDLDALHKVAKRLKRPVAQLVREAVRQVWLQSNGDGPVALWNGKSRHTSVEHDSIYDQPIRSRRDHSIALSTGNRLRRAAGQGSRKVAGADS